jgi:hypothetical protein
MDRAEYLEMCKRVAMLPKGSGGMKQVPPELCLKYKDMTFYPVGYTLTFTDKGKPSHTAILHDLKANSILECDLLKVME